MRLDNDGARARVKKYLVFCLGEDRFAIPLSQVKEVIGLTKIAPVPHAPAHLKGLINLRGRIISTIDLRQKLNLPKPTLAPKRPCILISEIQDIILGSIVDDVIEVAGIEDQQVQTGLDLKSEVTREYLVGAARLPDKPLTLVLDVSKVLDIDELKALSLNTAA